MNAASPCARNWIAAVLTPAGRGAVATIAVCADLAELQALCGERTFFQARNGLPVVDQELDRIVFGQWGAEDLVVCRTAENLMEIHCHGGQAAIQRILSDLNALGVETVGSEELLNVSMRGAGTRFDRDYQRALQRTRTFRTAEIVWQQSQLAGGFWEQVANRDRTLDEQLIKKAIRWANFGKHLTIPWQVVIAGPPNVGKSSLINQLLGYERAIVFDQPGTTRDVVTGETALEGWPVVLSDTAGQRETEHLIEAAGIELAVKVLEQADLQILLLDGSQPAERLTLALLEKFPQAMVVFNKVDLPVHPSWLNEPVKTAPLHVSCKTGEGVDVLMQTIVSRLVPELPDTGVIYPVNEQQEQLLQDWLSSISEHDI